MYVPLAGRVVFLETRNAQLTLRPAHLPVIHIPFRLHAACSAPTHVCAQILSCVPTGSATVGVVERVLQGPETKQHLLHKGP